MTASLQAQAEEAVSRLRIARSDLQTVEAQPASTGLPPAVKESVSAFANTRGGLLLLGIDEPGFRPIDIDAPRLARDLASACADDLDPPIAPDIDIVTITRDDAARTLNAFVQKVWFDDWTFRLESDNTLDASRCRSRQRVDGTTIDGTLALIQDSCSSRYRRLTLSIQTVF